MCIGTTTGRGHCKFPPTCHFGGELWWFPRLFLGETESLRFGVRFGKGSGWWKPLTWAKQVVRTLISSVKTWNKCPEKKNDDDICWRWDPMVTLVPEIVNKNSLLSTTFVVLLLSTQRLSLSYPGNLRNLWNLWLICKIIQIDSIVSAICHQEISLLRDANGTKPHLVVWDLENRFASLSIPCYDFPI